MDGRAGGERKCGETAVDGDSGFGDGKRRFGARGREGRRDDALQGVGKERGRERSILDARDARLVLEEFAPRTTGDRGGCWRRRRRA